MAVGPETTETRSESHLHEQSQHPDLVVDDEVSGGEDRSQTSRDDAALLVRF